MTERILSPTPVRLFNRADLVWLAAIIVLALVLRAAWVLYSDADPRDGRFDDSVFYHFVAVSIADGNGYNNPFSGLPTAQWPPGYSFLLTGLYWLSGPSVAVAKVANVILGTATTVLVYLLVLQLLGRWPARAAGALFTAFPSQVLFASLVYSETLFTFLFILGLLLIVCIDRQSSPKSVSIVGLGLAAGATVLVREQGLALLLIAVLYWGFSGQPWRRAATWTATAVLASAALVVPWAFRNALALDALIPVSSSSGSNFWQGHHDGATGEFDFSGAERFITEHGPRTRPGGEVDISTAGFREGRKFLMSHPAEEIELSVRKIKIMYERDDQALDLNDYTEQKPFMPVRLRAALEVTANGYYYCVLGFALLGAIVLAKRRHPALLLSAITIAVVTLGTVAFFAQQRYHYPLIPVFCVLAASGLVWLWETARERALTSR